MRTTILAAIMLALPGAAAEQDRFDLICTAKKETVRYRIDLTAGEWCADQCTSVNKIAEVTSGMITLYEEKAVTANGPYSYGRINRLTGEWKRASWTPSYNSFFSSTGSCTPASFSGLNAGSRKF